MAMAQVSVTINKRKYDVACDDGQEAHLVRLAAYVDKKISELAEAMGQIGDARLLVVASLLIADELSDAYAEMETLKADGSAGAVGPGSDGLGSALDSLAIRIEDIAARLEQA